MSFKPLVSIACFARKLAFPTLSAFRGRPAVLGSFLVLIQILPGFAESTLTPAIVTSVSGPESNLDISLSADGAFAVLSKLDRFALLNTERGLVMHERSPGPSWVRATAVDPRGRFIISAAISGLSAWSLPDLEPITKLASGDYQDVEISADGHLIAAAERHGAITLWKSDDFSPIWTRFMEGPLSAVAISKDGSLVAASHGVNDQTATEGRMPAQIGVWSTANGSPRWRRDAHQNDIVDLLFVNDDRHILSASGDSQYTVMRGGSLALRKVTSGNLVKDFGGYAGMLSDLSPDPRNSKRIFGLAGDPRNQSYSLISINVETGTFEALCAGLTSRLRKIAILPSGTRAVAVANWGPGVWVWDAFPNCGDLEFTGLSENERAYRQIMLDGSNTLVLTTQNNMIAVDFAAGRQRFSLKADRYISALQPGPAADQFSTLEGQNLCVRDAYTGVEVRCTYLGGIRPSFNNFVYLDAQRVALAVMDSSGTNRFRTGNVIIYDLKDRAILASEMVHADEITDMLVVGEIILSSSWDGTIRAVSSTDLSPVRTYLQSDEQILDLDLSSDGSSFVAGWTAEEDGSGVVGQWHLGRSEPDWRGGGFDSANVVRYADSDDTVIVGSSRLLELSALNGKEKRVVPDLPLGESITELEVLPDSRIVLGRTVGGNVRLWGRDVAGVHQVARVFLSPERMITFAGEKFDGAVEELTEVGWIMPDDPLNPLPPEIFMRDYYEPGLLGRLLACRKAEASGERPGACEEAFQPVRPLVDLNRVQPDVKIVEVRQGEAPDIALVEVEVSEVEDLSQKNGKTRTGVYDVRLFRDGQLVGQWPEPREGASNENDLEAWRRVSRVEMPGGQTRTRHTFEVRLAARDMDKAAMFTAYGFNEDRVKSATDTDDGYTVPEEIAPRTPRAYVITVGVNKYENPERNLSYAVNDARDLAASLQDIQGYEVVPLSLVSDIARDGAAAVDQATKFNIRAVLDLLAGKGEAERERLRHEIGPAIDDLAKATPDDLVVLSFSGHGHTEQGRFYLLPSDSGKDGITDAVLENKLISSEDLTDWLRGVDAGEMVMIVDACHSAAGVPAGFKPGPMGDRGLGQLAYDKGMRILAATQADDVALESDRLGQGLLTYALEEGLQAGEDGRAEADQDGHGVTMREWLGYAVDRVPALYEEIRAGTLKLASRAGEIDPELIQDTTRHAQTPALFDFARQNTDADVLLKGK